MLRNLATNGFRMSSERRINDRTAVGRRHLINIVVVVTSRACVHGENGIFLLFIFSSHVKHARLTKTKRERSKLTDGFVKINK